MDEGLRNLLLLLAAMAGIALLTALVLLALLYRKLRRLRIPRGADFWTTLRAVPLGLVVILDLLDLSLDFLSAPVVWALLSKLKLQGLREVATVQALVPITGPIPVLTLGWLAARALRLGRPFDPDLLEADEVAPGRYEVRRE